MLLAALVLQTLFIAAGRAQAHGPGVATPHRHPQHRPHAARRSVASVASLPMSKGGWRPVVGNAGFSGYSLLSGSPLQAPKYKISVPVAGDSYPTASKNAPTRDANKLTSIAQSYKPTTLRSLSLNNFNAPVNAYLNPFSLPNTGLSHYKIVQNFPMESVVIRNPNPYQNRPLYAKYPSQITQNNINKYKQNQLHNAMMQQLAANNYQMYPTTVRNPHDPFSKPVEVYVRPTETAKKPELYARPEVSKKPDYAKPGEVRKPEVYKIPDSTGAQQSLNKQQVKTAQQTLAGTFKPPSTASYQHYTFKDDKFSPIPPSILGSFGTYGFQSVKARDPAFSGTKTTYLPPAPTKHTVFNSFSFTPTLNSQVVTTTPKVKLSQNQNGYGNTFNNNFQVQPIKQTNTYQSNFPNKGSFKASPQDPFAKPSVHPQTINNQPQIISNQQQAGNFYNPFNFNQFPQQISTYYTTIPTTTADTSLFSTNPVPNRFVSQLNPTYTTFSTYYGQHTKPDYEQNKQTVGPTASYQDDRPHYSVNPTKDKLASEPTPNTVPFRATYDVTETYEIETQPPQISWLNSPDTFNSYSNQQQTPTHETEESDIAADIQHEEDPTKLPQPELPNQYTYAAEGNEKPYNSLNYETDMETQSRRPLGDDFEPNQIVGKHKLKDHYYRVTTPTYSNEATTRHSDLSTDITTRRNVYREHSVRGNENSGLSDQLPTLPPHKHFRRPNPEVTEKEKYRKKNKNRRRRPTSTPAEIEEVSDHSTTVLPIEVYTTEDDGTVHTVRPRVRIPIYGKPKTTTPTVTTDLSTSALPTLSPTTPTILRKKHGGRRTTTPSPNEEYTTTVNRGHDLGGKGSSIMKIAIKQPVQKSTTYSYDYSTSETPDYSHKQDEKDTPTSDIAVNTSGDDVNENANSGETFHKGFNFHVNVKPIDNKLEHRPSTEKIESSNFENKGQDSNNNSLNQENEKEHDNSEEITTTTSKAEVAQLTGKLQRPRLKHNKYDTNRPRFSVKDYRNRLSSTTTTEKPQESFTPKLRFPQRRLPVYNENKFQFESDNSTETSRKKFTPKDPRHKQTGSEDTVSDTTTERHSFSTRTPTIRNRPAPSSTESPVSETAPPKISSRIRTNPRNQLRSRTSTTEEPAEQFDQAPVHIKRPLRKKQKETQNFEKDSLSEPSEDVVVTETTTHEQGSTSERYRSESAIMKIAKDEKKHQSSDHPDQSHLEHSKRVSDLTLAASKDYNTPGLFKTVSPISRRIPNYFTIATDDPILPIEAFFPQLNQKKES